MPIYSVSINRKFKEKTDSLGFPTESDASNTSKLENPCPLWKKLVILKVKIFVA
jgi:hypothetical protein